MSHVSLEGAQEWQALVAALEAAGVEVLTADAQGLPEPCRPPFRPGFEPFSPRFRCRKRRGSKLSRRFRWLLGGRSLPQQLVLHPQRRASGDLSHEGALKGRGGEGGRAEPGAEEVQVAGDPFRARFQPFRAVLLLLSG